MRSEYFVDFPRGATERRTVAVIVRIEKKDGEQTSARLEHRSDCRDIVDAARRIDGAKTGVFENAIEGLREAGRQSEQVAQEVLLVSNGRMSAGFFQGERRDVQSGDIETLRGQGTHVVSRAATGNENTPGQRAPRQCDTECGMRVAFVPGRVALDVAPVPVHAPVQRDKSVWRRRRKPRPASTALAHSRSSVWTAMSGRPRGRTRRV